MKFDACFLVALYLSLTAAVTIEDCSSQTCSSTTETDDETNLIQGSIQLQHGKSQNTFQMETLDINDSEATKSLLEQVSQPGAFENPSALLQIVRKLAVASVKGKAPASVKDAVDLIVKKVNTIIITAITKEHTEDQNEVIRDFDSVKKCSTDMQDGFNKPGTGVDALKAGKTTKENAMTTCREKEVVELGNKKKLCGDFNSWASNLKNGVPACAAAWPTEPKEMLTCMLAMKAFADANIGIFQAKQAACDKAKGDTSTTKTTCTDSQSAFEQGFCSYAQQLTEVCDSYSECRTKTIKVFGATKTDVAAAVTDRKTSYVAAKNIVCYAGVVSASDATKAASLKKCDSAASTYDTSSLDIVFTAVPAVLTCDTSPVASKPCDASFLATHYSSKAWNDKAPADTCTPCASGGGGGGGGWVEAGATLPASGATVVIAGAQWEFTANWDCGGADLASYTRVAWGHADAVANRKECAQWCLDKSNCVGFNYPQPGNGRCWVKHSYKKSPSKGWACGGANSAWQYYTLLAGPTVAPATTTTTTTPAGPVTYKHLGPGYCKDYKYLPEGGYPPRLPTTSALYDSDAKIECANRCLDAVPQKGISNQAFYMRYDGRCGCSYGDCTALVHNSNAYQSYAITSMGRWAPATTAAPGGSGNGQWTVFARLQGDPGLKVGNEVQDNWADATKESSIDMAGIKFCALLIYDKSNDRTKEVKMKNQPETWKPTHTKADWPTWYEPKAETGTPQGYMFDIDDGTNKNAAMFQFDYSLTPKTPTGATKTAWFQSCIGEVSKFCNSNPKKGCCGPKTYGTRADAPWAYNGAFYFGDATKKATATWEWHYLAVKPDGTCPTNVAFVKR